MAKTSKKVEAIWSRIRELRKLSKQAVHNYHRQRRREQSRLPTRVNASLWLVALCDYDREWQRLIKKLPRLTDREWQRLTNRLPSLR